MSNVDNDAALDEFSAMNSDERETKLFKILTETLEEIKSLKQAKTVSTNYDLNHDIITRPDYHISSGAEDEFLLSNTNQDEPVTLNVGGTRFRATWTLLHHLPQSRLGKLSSCSNKEEAFQLCDAINTQTNEYQFNYPPRNFDSVLSFLATGRLHFGKEGCMVAFKQDMDYWGINILCLEPCCAQSYNEQPDFLKWDGQCGVEKLDNEGTVQLGSVNRMKKLLWDLVENPHTSIGAKVIAGVSVVGILTSIAIFSFYTLPEFEDIEDHAVLFLPFVLVDGLYALWFTLEFIVRVVCCPSRINFLKNPLNWIDLLGAISYYSSFVFDIHSFIYEIFLFFRVLRILRILKFAHRLTGLRSLGLALKSSFKELFMLLLLLGAAVIIFSTPAHIFEKSENERYSDMFSTYWWAIITITTVGYGDMYTETFLGQIVASFCAICGVIFIGLPIPIIGYKFATFYKYEKCRQQFVDNKAALEVARKNGQMRPFFDTFQVDSEKGENREMQVAA